MNARRESKERNLTWRIQEDNNCWTHLEHFLESISCILYVVLKLGKLEIQHFKWCMNQSWNEEVRAIGSQSHQAKGQFHKLRNHTRMAAKSAFGCENVVLLLRKFHNHFAQCRGVLLKLPDRHFEIFCFRYLMSKSPFSPCNPPIIGFPSL